ncbi:MAG: glutamine-hydrolyzing carbamoyl-phosphate synthase small subunit [Deltaproteobacteria bacterium]|jgi:carbamoyl-phosphate synthase small subunit|nr:glutamine-hydrolyzing carbamoyl-phosphate synthase small subunit [Deltaproteobacteria bacterium]
MTTGRPSPGGGNVTLTPAALTLDDGASFAGLALGAGLKAEGEAIFITAMSGYQEVLTDPSYHGQIVVFTAAHVGNYGTNPAVDQAPEPQVAGVVFHELWLPEALHWLSEADLPEWLRSGKVGALTGVDTRALTLHIRERGARNGVIAPLSEGVESAYARARAVPSMNGLDLAVRVFTKAPYRMPAPGPAPDGGPAYRVAVLDFGVKRSILEQLSSHGMDLTVWPGDTAPDRIMDESPQGVFLANGPGDPAACSYAVRTAGYFLGRKPLFGICLGHQIMGLAAGGRTYKLPFGHHGLNHPVLDSDTGKVLITSQNHGFCVDPDSLPSGVRANMWNLNDGTVEGLAWEDAPAFCVQFHPEASPGPHDSRGLFARFRRMIKEHDAQA